MQDVDDSSLLAAAICEALAEKTGADSVRDAAGIVREILAPLVAAALTGRRVAAIAHELRNPLAVIATSTSILAQRAGDDERVRKHLQRIEAQVKIASTMALELLEGASPRPPAIDRAELLALLAECVDAVALPPTITVQISAPSAPRLVLVDRRRTAQIIVNLLNNARAACADAGELRLEVRDEGPYVLLLVRDNGPGIPEDAVERVFAIGESKSAHGHGLGLAIAREFARAQGGDLVARPSDRGALFVLTMRAEPQPQQQDR
jgi:signal transduction histidine kinase